MSDATCSIEGCQRPFYARSMCSMHYNRVRLTGTPEPTPEPTKAQHFWAKVEAPDPWSCWCWKGGIGADGYGRFYYRGPTKAHRTSWEMNVGPIPDGLHIDHLCRNRACVNPLHLEPVTQAENIRRGEAGKYMVARSAERTHCMHGHPLDGDNLRICPSRGWRQCRTCMRISAAKSNRRRAAAKRAAGDQS